jgi:hypothetical protein
MPVPPLKSPTVPKPAGGCAPRPQGPTSPAGPSIGSARCVLGSDSKITVFSSFAYQASGYRAPGWSELPVREDTPPPKARAVEGRLADTRLCLFFTHKIDPPAVSETTIGLRQAPSPPPQPAAPARCPGPLPRPAQRAHPHTSPL